jgi:hypothetical protein
MLTAKPQSRLGPDPQGRHHQGIQPLRSHRVCGQQPCAQSSPTTRETKGKLNPGRQRPEARQNRHRRKRRESNCTNRDVHRHGPQVFTQKPELRRLRSRPGLVPGRKPSLPRESRGFRPSLRTKQRGIRRGRGPCQVEACVSYYFLSSFL